MRNEVIKCTVPDASVGYVFIVSDNCFDLSCDSHCLHFLAHFRSARGTKGKKLSYLNLSIIIFYVFKFLWRLRRIISKLQLWKWSLAAVLTQKNQVGTFDPSTAVSQTMFSSLLRLIRTMHMQRLWRWQHSARLISSHLSISDFKMAVCSYHFVTFKVLIISRIGPSCKIQNILFQNLPRNHFKASYACFMCFCAY